MAAGTQIQHGPYVIGVKQISKCSLEIECLRVAQSFRVIPLKKVATETEFRVFSENKALFEPKHKRRIPAASAPR